MSEFKILTVATTPFEGQRPGTSGLRKKVTVASQPNYIENFVQAMFIALNGEHVGKTLVAGGDGRYLNSKAMEIIVRMSAANGVGRLVMMKDHLASTPAVSFIIRDRKAFGGFILTASHNPGGPDGDFGIKYNAANGGPAQAYLTEAMYKASRELTEYKIGEATVDIDFSIVGEYTYGDMTVEVIDPAEDYTRLMKSIFDFDKIAAFLAREDVSVVHDSMYGVCGPFAKRILLEELKAPASSVLNATPKEDFGGLHPDPNLTYAHDLAVLMGVGADAKAEGEVPTFGAAADGDADRNMILGSRFFVTPSDSVAIIAANAVECIPYFKDGLKGVARSMPTSGALDFVAKALGVTCYEVPTGWKYFGNLMDAGSLSICGEESFGTGSDHIREKDGLWAVLCWLSILATKNEGQSELVTVEDIVRAHWAKYGRNYYTRYDYEQVDKEAALGLMEHLRGEVVKAAETKSLGEFKIGDANEFTYTDPVDGAVARRQGIRFIMEDGSRIIFRLSGTGSVGATIRLYVEKYESDPSKLDMTTAAAIGPLVAQALTVSQMEQRTGRNAPTVIT